MSTSFNQTFVVTNITCEEDGLLTIVNPENHIGAEKLSGWDSAITAEKGTRFSAIARPIKVEIFKHNDVQLLPPVAHTMYSWGCGVRLLQAAAYLVAMVCGAVSRSTLCLCLIKLMLAG